MGQKKENVTTDQKKNIKIHYWIETLLLTTMIISFIFTPPFTPLKYIIYGIIGGFWLIIALMIFKNNGRKNR